MSAEAFKPGGDRKTSINWRLDQAALVFTRSQRTSGHGVAEVELRFFEELETLLKDPAFEVVKSPIPETNPYHGDIVFPLDSRQKADRPVMLIVTNYLAMRATILAELS